MVLPEASLGDATRSVPTGSPLGSSRVPTHTSDVRIVLALAGGGEAKFYGGAEVSGRSLAEYEHRAALLRGPVEALFLLLALHGPERPKEGEDGGFSHAPA